MARALGRLERPPVHRLGRSVAERGVKAESRRLPLEAHVVEEPLRAECDQRLEPLWSPCRATTPPDRLSLLDMPAQLDRGLNIGVLESADKIRAHVGAVTVEVSEAVERAVAALAPPGD